jgi:hypothetical protein
MPFDLNSTNGVGHSLGAVSLAGLTRNLVHFANPAVDEFALERVWVVKRPNAERAVGRKERVNVAIRPVIVQVVWRSLAHEGADHFLLFPCPSGTETIPDFADVIKAKAAGSHTTRQNNPRPNHRRDYHQSFFYGR